MSKETPSKSDNEERDAREEHDDSEEVTEAEPEATPGTSFADSPANIGQVGRKSVTGQTCSLKTLIDDDVLAAGENVLAMEYMVGDILLVKLETDDNCI